MNVGRPLCADYQHIPRPQYQRSFSISLGGVLVLHIMSAAIQRWKCRQRKARWPSVAVPQWTLQFDKLNRAAAVLILLLCAAPALCKCVQASLGSLRSLPIDFPHQEFQLPSYTQYVSLNVLLSKPDWSNIPAGVNHEWRPVWLQEYTNIWESIDNKPKKSNSVLLHRYIWINIYISE